MPPTIELRLAHGNDGEPLPYQIDGRPGPTAMLTAHGLVSSVHHWQYFIPYFAAQRPVLSWHYRGHGGQPTPVDRGVTIAQFANDAAAVARASELGSAIVVGLSFGVQVALELWRRHPDTVRALVLICGTPGHPLDRISSSPRLRQAMIESLRQLGRQRALASTVLAMLGSRVGRRVSRELAYLSGGADRASCPTDVLDGLFAHVAGLDPELIASIVGSYLEHSAEDILPSVAVPTLIIAGDQDQLTPVATAERMQRLIPRSQLVVFPGHTHLVQVEIPDRVHATIDGFLRQHSL